MQERSIAERFEQALDALIEQVRDDRSVLAAILCGSLSHDRVWAGSDIDLVLVTIDDTKVEQGDLSLYADGVNVHAHLVPRAQLRKIIEGSTRNSFMHAFLGEGRNSRSNPATFIGCYDAIRDLFTQTPLSVERGYKAGRFSFNVKGGRCEECQGEGVGAYGHPDRASPGCDQDGRSRDRPRARRRARRRRGGGDGNTGAGRRLQEVAHRLVP
jgi:hypothetical protein